MTQRFPTARAYANSTAKVAIHVNGKAGQKVYEISPAMAGSLVALATLVTTGALAASLYVFSRDDLMHSVLAGQARMQYAYEDRIAQLRAHLDRVTGRQLVDQDTVESKLQELISRQVQLESRQAVVARLADDATRAGVRIGVRPGPAADPVITGSIGASRPAPPPAASGFAPVNGKPVPEGAAGIRPEPLDGLRTDRVSMIPLPPAAANVPSLMAKAEVSAQSLANQQLAVLGSIEATAQTSARRYRDMLAHTGLNHGRFAKVMGKAAATPTDIGGPLIPLKGSDAVQFEKSLAAAQTFLREAEGMNRVVRSLPVRRPLPKSYDTSSTFGTRVDPFTRGYAMHSGLDFRASTGTPVRATADGKVVHADWQGGYGRLVEVDHGFGLTTRYAHLSAIEVSAGDTIRKGDVVGEVGSSGRSTGPHLHYEVRIDEEAVDPVSFLRAGEKTGID